MTWAEIWNAIKNFFTTSGVMVAKALLLFIIGYVVVRLVMVLIKRVLKRTKLDRVAQGFLLSGIKFVLYMILLIMVIQQFGVEITGIVAAFAAAGLAVSLALQNSLSNVASGIILLVTKPFKENDLIAVAGVEGKVQNIHILTTSLVTLDNKLVVLPNSTVAGNPITNYSNKKTRRVEFTFSVAYESNTELVKKVVLDVFKSNGKILLDPAPFCSMWNYRERVCRKDIGDLNERTINCRLQKLFK